MRPTETIALRREPGHLIRSLTALILRGGLGMIFLTAGLDKLEDMNTPAPEPANVEADLAEAETGETGAPGDANAELRYPETIRAMFADTWLGRDLKPVLDLHTALLPYAEVAVGALLIVGLLTTLSAFAAGLLLLSLTFGLTVAGSTDMYPNMMIYLMVSAGILWLSPITSNYLSVDGLLFGFVLKPNSEGEYRKEYEAPVR